jgi:hypothetical protein
VDRVLKRVEKGRLSERICVCVCVCVEWSHRNYLGVRIINPNGPGACTAAQFPEVLASQCP